MVDRSALLVGTAAVLTLLAGLPAAAGLQPPRAPAPADPPSARVVAAAGVVPGSGLPDVAPPVPLGLPGSTTTLPTSSSYDGELRTVVLHVPDGLLAPAPLVVALHAHSQEPAAIRAYSRLEALADRHGFVVAFPSGAGGSWNAGGCCAPGTRDAVDDVAFLDEVLALVQARVPIDPRRIGLTGGSNGAMMALRYACERADVVASVAVVAGPLMAPCTPSRAVPVLVLHGAGDRVVPLAGGPNPALGVVFPPLERSLEPFRRAGGEVSVRVVPRAGHEWMTRYRHGVDASAAVWSWLRDHPRTG